MADIIVDGTSVGANRFLFLDSTGKIPAVDGSQVTTIAAGNIATGTIPIARIDVGTTANKLVQLDANAKLPALDASLLTNIPGATKNASDPAIDTNPSGGVGSEWHNTTSGEAYICTDATAGANVWTNVGAGTGDVAPFHGGGENYGFAAGGNLPGTVDRIEKFSFATDGDATDHGDLFELSSEGSSGYSTTHGYHAGGYTGPSSSNKIQKFAFASNTTGTEVGSLITTDNSMGGASSTTHVYTLGGYSQNIGIRRMSFASEGAQETHGNLYSGRYGCVGTNSATHGYGMDGSGGNANIDKFSFASNTTAALIGTIPGSQNFGYGSAGQTATDGYLMGGNNASPAPETVHKVSFVTDGNSTDWCDLHTGATNNAGASSKTHGYVAGGGDTQSNHIGKFAFASQSIGTDVGNLVSNRRGLRGSQY